MPLLCGLPRLSSLALQHLAGLASLPQLHPLLRLPGLRHLAVGGCPLAGLVLLRPYAAFRWGAEGAGGGEGDCTTAASCACCCGWLVT